jgi:hypothetical protein
MTPSLQAAGATVHYIHDVGLGLLSLYRMTALAGSGCVAIWNSGNQEALRELIFLSSRVPDWRPVAAEK